MALVGFTFFFFYIAVQPDVACLLNMEIPE
jgi:hypothetical protein